MSSLKHYIRIVESESIKIVKVFHGTRDSDLKLRSAPLYGVVEEEFAMSYALERSHGHDQAFVYTIEFRFRKLASDKDVGDLCDELDIFVFPSTAGVITEHPELIEMLQKRGFDGVFAYDFDFEDKEREVYCVFNAARQARILSCDRLSKRS